MGWHANEIAIHGYTMNVQVPDVMETKGELNFPTTFFGVGPCFHSFGIFKL
jgi:hypothetical protein